MKNWPADKVERRSISDLIPYARNSRTHSQDQVKQIAASMKEWGWTNPVLIDEENGIIAGHGRVMAAELLGYEDIPCMVAEGWSEAQKRAYVIADNKLALNADWDSEMLTIELKELSELNIDISVLGFEISKDSENLESDIFLFDDDNSKISEFYEPSKAEEGYAEMALVMKIENKKILIETINRIKQDHGVSSNEDAIMILVESYA